MTLFTNQPVSNQSVRSVANQLQIRVYCLPFSLSIFYALQILLSRYNLKIVSTYLLIFSSNLQQVSGLWISNMLEVFELFQLFGFIVFLYYAVSVILWVILDTDIELFIAEKTGKPIGKMFFI